jgi:predicted RNA-binding protein with RPS1 domain
VRVQYGQSDDTEEVHLARIDFINKFGIFVEIKGSHLGVISSSTLQGHQQKLDT